MKTSQDPRHKKRQHLVQQLFSHDFQQQHVSPDVKIILDHKEAIDSKIQQAAPEFPLQKINKTDLAVLRLATYELLIDQKEPQNVIIDEAVELAKEFGNDSSSSFVNGVLGHIISYAKLT